MKEIIIPIISAIVGALISAIVTLYIQKRKEKREDKEKAQLCKKEIFQNRPEYKIIDYKDYISRTGYGIKQQCDIDAFLTVITDIKVNGRVDAIYRKEDFNQSEWCCVIYTLQNVGKTDILMTDLVCHQKRNFVLFDSKYAVEFLNAKCLNYSVSSDNKIRVGETFTIKLCFHKDSIIHSLMSAILLIAIKDVNGNYWEQPLFIPFNKIYDSHQISHKNYHSDITVDDAEECFRDPWKW